MLRRPFRNRRSFMYAAVCDMNYIAESDASWEKKRLGGETVGLQYPVSLLRNTDSMTGSMHCRIMI